MTLNYTCAIQNTSYVYVAILIIYNDHIKGRNQTKGTPPPGVGHNQAHPGGNISNRSDRGGGSQHRGSIGNASGAYGHNQGASANATGSAGRDQSSSQDDYGPRGASTGSGRQEFKQDLRPRLNYGKHKSTILICVHSA